METSLKTGLPKFLLPPKKSELPKIWEGEGSPRNPPGSYAYVEAEHFSFKMKVLAGVQLARKLQRVPFCSGE